MALFATEFKSVLGFLCLTLLFSMIGGNKAATWFLIIVLIGMLVTNKQHVQQITTFLTGGGANG